VTQIFGIVGEHRAEDDVSTETATFYIVPFHIVDVRKNEAYRPPGICYMQIVFAAGISIDPLSISTDQRLWFGGDVSVSAEMSVLFPFSTGPYHGFADLESGRVMGDGHFFLSLAEAKKFAARYYSHVEIVDLSAASD
jgi:hypothetical protein